MKKLHHVLLLVHGVQNSKRSEIRYPKIAIVLYQTAHLCELICLPNSSPPYPNPIQDSNIPIKYLNHTKALQGWVGQSREGVVFAAISSAKPGCLPPSDFFLPPTTQLLPRNRNFFVATFFEYNKHKSDPCFCNSIQRYVLTLRACFPERFLRRSELSNLERKGNLHLHLRATDSFTQLKAFPSHTDTY
ncbi:uncharacterized protein LY89DRAFT_288524 [Mollisia scopiformis]|uniref:Uncharacterized protein n=1 Tax=Mollisia scopiformis TaxID=149040 RepID=A0A132BAR4_MOLSC|nr:uncharacterized protein LY89DRAFT_288524 [Mollisia scopiformis]KUJ09468.1 hypothetical protein LY89DRAFT_288524 [Mollisia scopiformis]